MADDSYYGPYAEFRKRDNFADAFRSVLDDVAGRVDLGWVRSCVAFGTGSGEPDIELVRRLMPSLRSFAAVEPDPESAGVLRANFRKSFPPDVETSVAESRMQSWSGADGRVDAALLLNVLSPITSADRQVLFKKLMTNLSSGGIVVINNNITSVPSGYVLVLKRLGTSRVDFDELEKEMVEAGFGVLLKHDFEVHRDLSNPNDGVVECIRRSANYKYGQSETRAVINDVFSDPSMHMAPNRLAIFKKQD